ncbi:MAG TPA: N-acetylmuramoyl-L-alanine amidase [Chitinophagaceae bacterium]|nr:N-acetylmuramoyl-L-alanine amidase [Chitinophagaceae bacterium]
MKYPLLALVLYCFFSCKSQNINLPVENPPGFWLARSKGKFTQLAYSLGQDRLGSAKEGYIDTNVLLKVIDSIGSLYQVQLSKYHTAYVAKSDLARDTSAHLRPFYLTNSWHERPDTAKNGKHDSLYISMDERLPYKSWMEINPSKIMIDIYGIESNTNWITQLSTIKEIKNVYFNQVEDDVVRVTIELKHQQHWGYTILYKDNYLVVAVKRQPADLNIQKLKIAIDAGHGGTNIGAEGVTRHINEKDYTLLFAKALQKYLKSKGVKEVIMTRTKDTTFGNTDRVLWLQQQQPDILVSLHLNSADGETKGSSTYYKHIGFRPLSIFLLKEMVAAGMDEYGNTGNFNFLLNQPTDFPNALLEIGFLSNIKDERKILKTSFHALVAKQVYQGIVDFLNNAKKY